MAYKKGFVKISEDYIVLSAIDAPEYNGATQASDVLEKLTWETPMGAYSSIDVRHPMITELEVVTGCGHIGAKTIVVRYENGVFNQYTSGGYPVIGYCNTRASNSAVILGNGKFIVNPKPSKIVLGLAGGNREDVTKGNLDGFNITLRYCYYEPE